MIADRSLERRYNQGKEDGKEEGREETLEHTWNGGSERATASGSRRAGPKDGMRAGLNNAAAAKSATIPLPSFPPPRNRHSRVSGNPENPAGSKPVFDDTVLDSRLRGKDGCGAGWKDGRDRIIRAATIIANPP